MRQAYVTRFVIILGLLLVLAAVLFALVQA